MGIRWSIQDRLGNNIYLTEERWQQIVDPHRRFSGISGNIRL
jgi:hypothetical protein